MLHEPEACLGAPSSMNAKVLPQLPPLDPVSGPSSSVRIAAERGKYIGIQKVDHKVIVAANRRYRRHSNNNKGFNFLILRSWFRTISEGLVASV